MVVLVCQFCEEFDLIFQTPYWPGFLLQLFRVVRNKDKKTGSVYVPSCMIIDVIDVVCRQFSF